jgi:uncharacterized membrane protein
MFFGPVMLLLFIAAGAAVVYLMMRSARPGGGRAMEILEERYARGEIDQAEFEERWRLLRA